MVPICAGMKWSSAKTYERKRGTNGKIFWEALDSLAFSFVLSIKALRVELIAEPESFHFAIQAWDVGFVGSRQVEPIGSGGLRAELKEILGNLQTSCIAAKPHRFPFLFCERLAGLG
jgi:hypothetical protein